MAEDVDKDRPAVEGNGVTQGRETSWIKADSTTAFLLLGEDGVESAKAKYLELKRASPFLGKKLRFLGSIKPTDLTSTELRDQEKEISKYLAENDDPQAEDFFRGLDEKGEETGNGLRDRMQKAREIIEEQEELRRAKQAKETETRKEEERVRLEELARQLREWGTQSAESAKRTTESMERVAEAVKTASQDVATAFQKMREERESGGASDTAEAEYLRRQIATMEEAVRRGAGSGAAGTFSPEMFYTPEQREFYGRVDDYREASPDKQRELFQGWMLKARTEIERALDEGREIGQLFSSYRNYPFLLTYIMEKEDWTKDPGLHREEVAVWNGFICKVKTFGASDPISASKAVDAISGEKNLNVLYKDVSVRTESGAVLTVADAFEVADKIVRREIRRVELFNGGPPLKRMDLIAPVVVKEFTDRYGDSDGTRYLIQSALDLFVFGGRHSIYEIKKPLFWLAKPERPDREISGHKTASTYVVDQLDRVPAVIADYWADVIYNPKGTLTTTNQLNPRMLAGPLSRKELAKSDVFVTGVARQYGISTEEARRRIGDKDVDLPRDIIIPDDLGEDDRYLIKADDLRSKDWGGVIQIEPFYNDNVFKANKIIEAFQGVELIQLFANDPKAGIEAFSKLVEGNSVLQELSYEQRSAFLRALVEITIEYYRKPELAARTAEVINPGARTSGEQITTIPIADPRKSIAWNEAKKAGFNESALIKINLENFDKEYNTKDYVAAYASMLSASDKMELERKYYPNAERQRKIDRAAGVGGGILVDTIASIVGIKLK